MKEIKSDGLTSQPKIDVACVYEFAGERIQVIRIEQNECIVQRYGTRDRWAISIGEFEAGAYLPKDCADLDKYSTAEWTRGYEIYRAFQEIDACGLPITKEMLVGAGKKLPRKLGLRQMQEYRRRYLSNPSVSSCIPGRSGRKPESKHLGYRTEQIIEGVATETLRSDEGTSLEKIWSRVKELCCTEQLPAPSRDTVWRRLNERGISLARRRRAGPAKFRESMIQLNGKHEVGYPGAEFQVDHTQIDLMALDDQRRFALGRLWLTLVMCVFSRCIMGFFLSFLPPSMASVQRALALAVMDKRRALTIWGLDGLEWPMSGIPKSILTDHGKEFKSAAYLNGCRQHDITARWRLMKSWGGHIERLIGSLMGRLHLLPGTTFSNVPKRVGYQPEARAVMVSSEIVRYIVTQICEYHDTKHSALDGTPRMQWERYRHEVPHGVLRAPPMPAFFHDFLPEYTSTRQRDGLHWGGYVYNSRILAPIPVRQKVSYRIDHMDTSRALVRMHGGLFVEVPRITPVTYKEHSLERQLRACKTAQCYAPDVLHRKSLATHLGAKIVTAAKAETEAARAQAQVLGLPAPRSPLPAHVPDIVGPATISAPELNGDGAFQRPRKVLTTSKL